MEQKNEQCDNCKGIGLIVKITYCENCSSTCWKCENKKKNGKYRECFYCHGTGKKNIIKKYNELV